MKTINKGATRIFCHLLDKLGIETHIKLLSDGFMPLVIEQVDDQIETPLGKAQLYSLAHYYNQNGDAMRDPEMCFIVVDKRVTSKDYESARIFPQMYQQDNLGLYEESICIENGRVTTYKPVWQKGHIQFAEGWLKNISRQGFLKTH